MPPGDERVGSRRESPVSMMAKPPIAFHYDDPEVVSEWVRGYQNMSPRDTRCFSARLRFIESAGRICRGSRILSVGAGTGDHESRLSVPPICVDASALMSSLQRGKGLITVRASAERLPFEDSSFDLVISIDLSPLHYSADQRLRVLVEFGRVLRSQGRLILLTANERWARLQNLVRFGDPDGDSYYVSPRELARQLRSMGFRILRVPSVERFNMEPRNLLGALFGVNLMNHWTVMVCAKRRPDGSGPWVHALPFLSPDVRYRR